MASFSNNVDFRNIVIKNDYPIISGGVWNAVLDTFTGETIYTSNHTVVHGPVNMIHGVLNIKSGATVSGIYQLANMSGFGGDANPTINIENGGKLENSHIFNGFVNIQNGGVSENNEYVSEVVNIKNGGTSDSDSFFDPGDTAESGGTLINRYLAGGSSSFRTADSTAGLNVENGGKILNQKNPTIPDTPNIPDNNCDTNYYIPVNLLPGQSHNLPSGYVVSDYRRYMIKNDYPIISGGVWNAVLTSSGETIYTSNYTSVHGPVNMIHGVLNIKSGATVSGIYQLANMSGFGGDANPTINIENGGKLEDSHIFNGFVNIQNGGVSESNEYVSEVVNIKNGGTSDNDSFFDPGDTAERGGTLINRYLTGGSSSFRTADSTANVNLDNGGKIHNPHMANTGNNNSFHVMIPVGDECNGNNCSRTVSAGETVSNLTVLPSCSLSVYGKANNTIINGGSLYTYSGSVVTGVTDNNAGNIYASGGTLSDVTVNSAGNIGVAGGTLSNVTINSAGHLNASGGTLSDVTVNNTGSAYFTSAGTNVTNLKLNSASATLDNSATAIGSIISSGGKEYISTGSIDSAAKISYGGQQFISGTHGTFAFARDTTIYAGATQTVYDWGRTENVILSGGTLNVSAGGGINNDVNFISGGTVNVYSGAGVSTTIDNGGKEYVYNGGRTNNTIVRNGFQYVMSGGIVSTTTVDDNGIVTVNSFGTAKDITINNGGEIRISGGTVDTASINDNGIVDVNGGTINNVTIEYGGILNIVKGHLQTAHIKAGGSLLVTISEDTQLTPPLVFEPGSFFNDREVLKNITINNLTKENLTALFNDPTLFAPVDSNAGINTNTDKNITSPVNTNTDQNTTVIHGWDELNDLLNNPEYFEQEPNPFLRTVKQPDSQEDVLPKIDDHNNKIIKNDSPDSQAISLKGYTLEDGSQRFSFIPNGKTERIYNIGLILEKTGSPQLPVVNIGDVLFYGTDAVLHTQSGHYTSKIYVAQNALLEANTNAIIDDITVYQTATLEATNGQIGNLTVDGGTATFSKNAKLTGTLTLANGGRTTIETETGGIIDLQGTENNGLIISGKAAANGIEVKSTINNFDGNDKITLEDVKRSDVAGVEFTDDDHVKITLKDGSSITLHIIGIKNTGYILGENPDGSLTFAACFLAGTLISTFNSTMAVETIKTGDIVKTFDWKTNQTTNATVIWVGQKHTNVKTYLSDDLAGYPVRILKNAISENVPNKDLLVTPEHCLFFDGNFVPARMLVNGRSIYYDYSITSYDYYHIETEQHSVIWANGMLTESYLDTGNRNTFKNDQKVVSLFNNIKTWDNDAAAPLNVHRDFVEPIYNQINKRALDINFELQTEHFALTSDPNLYLTTELGTIIQPHACNNGKYIFNIPEGIDKVDLISRTGRPCETVGSFIDDRRELGVLVGNVFVINKNDIHEITDHLSNPDLTGWDVIEQSPCRWTKGKATLNIHATQSGKSVLIVNILAAGPYLLDEKKELYKKIG
ncbi:Hint domain-containing protein [Commensalibacter melissae]|uniref:Hint domain-containing protein n=3 Tax=Commensalibacter TaxID=1079922 RepID=UPI0018DE2BCC|nr:Hint domain-containing protein [Commensalibacter melissae]MBH9974040.1 Hint domain-containing protein [Commensalibacter melissae]